MKKRILGKVKKVIDVTSDDLDEILVGAFEGGSSYWADIVEVVDGDYKGGKFASDVISRGGELIIHTNDGEGHKLTQAKLINGIQIYLDNTNLQNFPFNDTQPDRMTYDNMLQYALFGELVYG
jgi:hypothetical protein